MNAFQFQSREACEAHFQIPGNYDAYRKLTGAESMFNIFKSLGWNIQNVPLPEPSKPIIPVPELPEAYARDFGAQSAIAQPAAQPVNGHSTPQEVVTAMSGASAGSEVKPYAESRFKQIALAAVARSEKRILPIVVGGKNPAIQWAHLPIHNASTQEWEGLYASWTDELAAKFQDLNACVVANENEVLFIDEDDSATFRKGYEAFAGEPFPVTYTTSARENRCQSHWRQTDATRKLGNVVQGATKNQMISVRQHQLYVLAEGSLHKNGVDTYKCVVNAPIIPMPDKLVAYIEFIRTDRNIQTGDFSKKPEGWLDEPFIHHNIDNQLVAFAGHYISAKNIKDADELYTLLIAKLEKNGCFEQDGVTPFAYNEKRVREIADDKVKVWPTGEEKHKANEVALTQKPDAPAAQQTAPAPTSVQQLPELDTSEAFTRPVFPYWAIQGTSIWDGLIEPALKTSSKHAEFIAVPAIQMMLNSLSGKVQVGLCNTNLNIFVGLISPYGEFFKSSSCALAMDYFHFMGTLISAGRNVKDVDGRTAIIQAGSPEGFGLQAKKINAIRALLFNDELGKFVSKAGIEGSAFSSDLLTWYGSGEFGNGTSHAKNTFHFEVGSYTFGWLWATTDRGFNRHWPKLAGISSGLEDRMFFVVSPEKPKPAAPYRDPNFHEGAKRTKQLIDKAVNQKIFHFESPEWFAKKVAGLDPRSMDLVQKLALYFCVDMDATAIDDEHIERAIALVQYRNQAAAYLAPIEADNEEGRTQKEIIRELRQCRGKMPYRDLCNALDYTRLGLFKWNRAFEALIKEKLIVDFPEVRTAGKRATRMIGLVKQDEG